MARVRLSPKYAPDVINSWINHRLMDFGWTLEDLARESGIPLSTLRDKRRRNHPTGYTFEQVAKICRTLECPKEKAVYFLLEMDV